MDNEDIEDLKVRPQSLTSYWADARVVHLGGRYGLLVDEVYGKSWQKVDENRRNSTHLNGNGNGKQNNFQNITKTILKHAPQKRFLPHIQPILKPRKHPFLEIIIAVNRNNSYSCGVIGILIGSETAIFSEVKYK